MTVVSCKMKSSAVSVSSFPSLARRESAPRRPSGVPVLNENPSAQAEVAKNPPTSTVAVNERKNFLNSFISFFPSFFCKTFMLVRRLDQETYDHWNTDSASEKIVLATHGSHSCKP